MRLFYWEIKVFAVSISSNRNFIYKAQVCYTFESVYISIYLENVL